MKVGKGGSPAHSASLLASQLSLLAPELRTSRWTRAVLCLSDTLVSGRQTQSLLMKVNIQLLSQHPLLI